MVEVLELALESVDGIVDCRLQPVHNEEGLVYEATILYPHIVNGFSRSEIYCHDLRRMADGNYHFIEDDLPVHPKIRNLEEKISAAITRLPHNY